MAPETLEPRRLLAAHPIISEFMADNGEIVRDGDGNSSDWIEIHYAGDESVNLADYRLTDDPNKKTKWVFPAVHLAAGEYTVVFASGQTVDDYVDASGNLHTNFALDKDGEYLALIAPDGAVVTEFGSAVDDYPRQLRDVSYGIAQSIALVDADSDATYHVPLDGNLGLHWAQRDFDAPEHGFESGRVAMGFEEHLQDRFSFSGEYETTLPVGTHGVYERIEFDLQQPSAVTGVGLHMKYDNGFVAYLNGVKVAEQNAPSDPQWYSAATRVSRHDSEALDFHQIDISDHRDALVDGTNVLAIHAMNHPSDLSDLLLVPELIAVVSDMHAAIGVEADVGYISTPTPGAPNVSNGDVFSGYIRDPQFSAGRGFYDEPLKVEITTQTPRVDVRYTTDGSPPTATTGELYAGPVTIAKTTTLRAAAFKPDHLSSRVVTHTFVFADDVLTQPASPWNFPDTWGTRLADYEMDPDVTTKTSSGVHDPRVRDALFSLPSVSIVADVDDLFDANSGIYSNPRWRGIDWERPVSMEYFGQDGNPEIQSNAGLRIQGNSSRFSSNPKHNMRLLFKGAYGTSKLEFPLFKGVSVNRFDTLILKGGHMDSWITDDMARAQYIREAWHRDTQLAMGQLSNAQQYVHLYLNGLYWGLYAITERPDASFFAQHLGGDKADYDVLRSDGRQVDGDKQAWNEMMEMLHAGLETDEAYSVLQGYLDIPNLIDFVLLCAYGGNRFNGLEWYAGRRRQPGAKWKFLTWDAENTFETVDRDRSGLHGANDPFGIHHELTRNAEYLMLFADHVHRHFFNAGALTPESVANRWIRRAEEIRLPLSAESARWGDSGRTGQPFTPDVEWQQELNWLRETYFPSRTDIVLRQLRDRGLYPKTESPSFNQSSDRAATDVQLSALEGAIYYTIDGSDPRLLGGAISPDAIEFTEPLHFMEETTIRARVFHKGEWSALSEATFVVPPKKPGDVNMDGVFDQLDIVAVSARGKYETGEPATFADGDWNADGIFDRDDVVVALQAGTYLPSSNRADFPVSQNANAHVDEALHELGDPFDEQLTKDKLR